MTFDSTGVLFVDDGSRVADNIWPLIQHLPHRKRLALAGAPGRPGIEDAATVTSDDIDVKGVVRAMERQHMLWAVMPRPTEDPAEILSDFLSQARHFLEEGYPAFILGLCRRGGPSRRVAVVVDRSQPFLTGSLLGAAVALALRTGAELTVLALGLAEDDLTDNPWELLAIDHESEFIEHAREALHERRVDVNWIPLGGAVDRDQAVIQAVREGGYEAVIDDIREINVGPRIGRMERVRRGLTEGSMDTSYRLLRDAHCDVYLVLDAARHEVLADKQIASGVGAAVLLGALAVGAGASQRGDGTDVPADQAIEAALDTAAADAVAEAHEAAPLVDVPEPRVIPGPEALPGEVSRDQIRAASNVVNEAQAGLDAEMQELADAQAASDAAAAALEAARAELASAQRSLDNLNSQQSALDREIKASDGELSDALKARQDKLNLNKAALQMRLTAAEQSLPEAEAAAAHAAEVVAAQDAVAFQVLTEVQQMRGLYAEAEQRVSNPLPTENFRLTARFGDAGGYWSSGYHTGLDFAAPQGTPLYAVDNGVVIEAGWAGAYGNYTVIRHSDGTTAHYAHQASIGVSVGQSVSAGQQIGTLGSTGNSTGPHLHFEIRDANGNFTDPAVYLGL